MRIVRTIACDLLLGDVYRVAHEGSTCYKVTHIERIRHYGPESSLIGPLTSQNLLIRSKAVIGGDIQSMTVDRLFPFNVMIPNLPENGYSNKNLEGLIRKADSELSMALDWTVDTECVAYIEEARGILAEASSEQ